MIIHRGASLGASKPPRRRPHLAVGVSPWKTTTPPPSREGGGSNHPRCSIVDRPGEKRGLAQHVPEQGSLPLAHGVFQSVGQGQQPALAAEYTDLADLVDVDQNTPMDPLKLGPAEALVNGLEGLCGHVALVPVLIQTISRSA